MVATGPPTTLRKLACTCWVDLGVDYMIAEMLLNHSHTRLGRSYTHTYADQRQAMADYHQLISSTQKS